MFNKDQSDGRDLMLIQKEHETLPHYSIVESYVSYKKPEVKKGVIVTAKGRQWKVVGLFEQQTTMDLYWVEEHG